MHIFFIANRLLRFTTFSLASIRTKAFVAHLPFGCATKLVECTSPAERRQRHGRLCASVYQLLLRLCPGYSVSELECMWLAVSTL